MRSDQSLPTSGKTRNLAGNGRRFAGPTTPYTEASREDAHWQTSFKPSGSRPRREAPGVHKRRMSLGMRAKARGLQQNLAGKEEWGPRSGEGGPRPRAGKQSRARDVSLTQPRLNAFREVDRGRGGPGSGRGANMRR